MTTSAFWYHFLNMCLVTSSFTHYHFVLSTEMNPSTWYHPNTGKLISSPMGLLEASLRSPVVHGLCFKAFRAGHLCLYTQDSSGPESSAGAQRAEVGGCRHHSLSLKLATDKKGLNCLITCYLCIIRLFTYFYHLVPMLYELQRWARQWKFKRIL